jgi:hypothetical protein
MNCSVNNEDCKHDSQHWHLNNYYGISGYFCGYHYNMVSHDAYGVPRNKESYGKILVIQSEYIALHKLNIKGET